MKKADKKILYSIVGFIGGLTFCSIIIPSNYEYKLMFSIVGGLIAGIAGYYIATK